VVMVAAAVVVQERPPVASAPRVVAVRRLCRAAQAGDLTDDEKPPGDWPGDEKRPEDWSEADRPISPR